MASLELILQEFINRDDHFPALFEPNNTDGGFRSLINGFGFVRVWQVG